jgi:hypothetical protein
MTMLLDFWGQQITTNSAAQDGAGPSTDRATRMMRPCRDSLPDGAVMLRGRTVRLRCGGARHYDPVIIVKAPVSARLLSEDERITIADLRRRGHTIRDIGTRLGRAPSRVSRELRRNQAPDGGYRPFRAHRVAQARRLRRGRGKIRQDRSSRASCRTASTGDGVRPRSAGRCAAVTPGGILGGQAQDLGAYAGWDGWSAGSSGLGGPAAGEELAVPAQDRGWRDQQAQEMAGG